MQQRINILTKTIIPNPNYSKAVDEVSKKNDEIYDVPKEIEDVQKTQITLDGLPDVVNKVSQFIITNYEVE
jgi:hypothetical protein